MPAPVPWMLPRGTTPALQQVRAVRGVIIDSERSINTLHPEIPSPHASFHAFATQGHGRRRGTMPAQQQVRTCEQVKLRQKSPWLLLGCAHDASRVPAHACCQRDSWAGETRTCLASSCREASAQRHVPKLPPSTCMGSGRLTSIAWSMICQICHNRTAISILPLGACLGARQTPPEDASYPWGLQPCDQQPCLSAGRECVRVRDGIYTLSFAAAALGLVLFFCRIIHGCDLHFPDIC